MTSIHRLEHASSTKPINCTLSVQGQARVVTILMISRKKPRISRGGERDSPDYIGPVAVARAVPVVIIVTRVLDSVGCKH